MPIGRPPTRALADWTDVQLVHACLDGSQPAWDELVDRYARLVYAVARRSGLAPADADEVFQNVFTIACRKLESLRDHERLAGWLARTAAREAARLGKRTRRGVPLADDLEAAADDTEAHAVAVERQQLVREALHRLGGRCERLLMALFLAPEQPSYEAIAEELGMRIGSIGPTRARCFRKLEKILEDMGVGEEVLR